MEGKIILKEGVLTEDFLNLDILGYLTRPFCPADLIFILTKAFKYQTLNKTIHNLRQKEYEFNKLHDAINNQAEKGIDIEISRKILVDRQRCYLMDRFIFFYKNNHQLMANDINAIENIGDTLCTNKMHCRQHVYGLKKSYEDTGIIMSKTLKGLEELSDRTST